MSTTFYAGPGGNGAFGGEIAFRENNGTVHWKTANSLRLCPCCSKPFASDEIVAHDEYGRGYTFYALMEELGQENPDEIVSLTAGGKVVLSLPMYKLKALVEFFGGRQ